VLYLAGGDDRSALLSIICAFVLCAATVVLRLRPALFAEQLCVAGILAASLVMYIHIAGSGHSTGACLTMFAAFAIIASLLPQTWMGVLSSAGMAIAGIFALHGMFDNVAGFKQGRLWPAMAMSAV
jgi:hypothetical protein